MAGNPSALQSISYDNAVWYSSKAKLYLRLGDMQFDEFRFPESISFYEQSVEFACKAICDFYGKKYDLEHSVAKPLKGPAIEHPEFKVELSRAALISSRCVGAMMQGRGLINYGNDLGKIPSNQIIKRSDVEPIARDAREVCDLLNKIEKRMKFKKPMRIGVLNGAVDGNDPNETKNDSYGRTTFRLDHWLTRLREIKDNNVPKYDVQAISISEMDNKFVAIVNPFGEIYPERDTEKRPALNKIKDYVSDGGIFVNAGGYAFFYAYDVAKGKRMELTSEIERWPSKMSIKNGNIQVQEFQTVLKFTGTPLYKDFGIITTSGGDPEQQNKVEAYQTQDDKSRFGELMTPGEPAEIIEYRAVTRESKGVIPVIRVIMPEDAREVYPIALVEFGYGHLLLCGMKINGEPEFGKIIMAVDRVCDWASSLG